MKLKKLQKRNVDMIISARVFSSDVETLKVNGINVSKLIRQTVSDAARRLK